MTDRNIYTYGTPGFLKKDMSYRPMKKSEPIAIDIAPKVLARNEGATAALSDWFPLELAKNISDYAMAMKLNIGVGRLGKTGVNRLQAGHPCLPLGLPGAHVIERNFLQTQAYRLAQVAMLLDPTMPKHKKKDDQKIGWSGNNYVKDVRFSSPDLEGYTGTLKAELPKSYEGNDRLTLVKQCVIQLKAILDLGALYPSGEPDFRLPLPSLIRTEQGLIKPLADAEGFSAVWFTLKVTIFDDLDKNTPKPRRRLCPEIADGGKYEKENWSNELEVCIPMGVYRAGKVVEKIEFDKAHKAFTKETFVPGLDLRYLYRLEAQDEQDSSNLSADGLVPAAFGETGKSPTNVIKEFVHWLNIRSAGELSKSQDWDPFKPNLRDFKKLLLDVVNAEHQAESLWGDEEARKQLREKKQSSLLLPRLGKALAVFTPDGNIHLLDSKIKVKAWATRESNLWDALAVAGSNYRDDSAPPPKLGIMLPHARDFGFQTLMAIDASMGWQKLEEGNFVNSTKAFRDTVAEIHATTLIEDQINHLLRLDKQIRTVAQNGRMTQNAIQSLVNWTNTTKLEATQLESLLQVAEQARFAVRELLRYRAAEITTISEGGPSKDELARRNRIRGILSMVPSRRAFDKALNGNPESFQSLRKHLLQMEYAREQPLDDDKLAEIDSIFVQLEACVNELPEKYSVYKCIPRALLRETMLDWADNTAKKTLNELAKESGIRKGDFRKLHNLFLTAAGYHSKPVKATKTFRYPYVEGYRLHNEYFDVATDIIDVAGVVTKKGKAPGLGVTVKTHLTFLRELSSQAAQVPSPAILVFSCLSPLENMYRGGQYHFNLKALRSFKRLDRSGNPPLKTVKRINDLIVEREFDETKLKRELQNSLKIDAVAQLLYKRLEERMVRGRTRRGGRVLLALGVTSLLIAGIATGGAAILMAAATIGAIKGMEGMREKYRKWEMKLDKQIENEAHLAALSAQAGNPMMIELGLLKVIDFHKDYDYIARYRAIENGMKFSDWYDAYIAGYKNFGK